MDKKFLQGYEDLTVSLKDKQYYYVVKVIKTDYLDYEEEIYETEYEAEKEEPDISACVSVLFQAIGELNV